MASLLPIPGGHEGPAPALRPMAAARFGRAITPQAIPVARRGGAMFRITCYIAARPDNVTSLPVTAARRIAVLARSALRDVSWFL